MQRIGNMQRTTLIFLTMALLLSACSVPSPAEPWTAARTEPRPQTTTAAASAPGENTEPASEEPASALRLLAVLDESSPGAYSSMALTEQEAVILLTAYPAGEASAPIQYFQFVDLQQGRLTDCVPIELSENGELNQIAFAADGSLLLSNAYRETAARYDCGGRLLETLPNPTEPRPELAHRLANDCFTVLNSGFGYYHCYEGNGYLYSAYAFADDPEALYLLDGGYDAVADARGHRILEADYLQNGAGLQYRVLDLDAGVREDTLTIPNDAPPELAAYTYLNAEEALLCGSRALLKVTWTQYDPERFENGAYGEGEDIPPARQIRIYDWQLRSDSAAPIELRRVTEAELHQTNAQLIRGITEEYPLSLWIGSEPDSEASGQPEAYDGASLSAACRRAELTPLRTYELLLQLRSFLEKLPAGLLLEMQRDFPGAGEGSGYSGFDIFLVREIPGDSTAYANSEGQRMSVCFAVDEFSASVLPHEFMHLMECRIQAWYEARGESFRALWAGLNPSEPGAPTEDWFVSFYAATNDREDRAETFARLFLEPGPLEEADWYKAHPHVQEKVRLLIEAIRNAYPSVQSAKDVYWEHP